MSISVSVWVRYVVNQYIFSSSIGPDSSSETEPHPVEREGGKKREKCGGTLNLGVRNVGVIDLISCCKVLLI